MKAAPPSSPAAMTLADLDFDLPAELVAQHPTPTRDGCRLLCARRGRPGELVERRFDQLADLLHPGDVLVRNVSKVLPARLTAVREGSGAPCELLLLEPAADGHCWWALGRPGKRLPAGARLQLEDGTPLVIAAVAAGGARQLEPPPGVDLADCAHRLGRMPLPPYIRRAAEPADRDDYQTVYARVEGSVAAPTAGLHFTAALLARLAAAGIHCADLVLHVGPGTFQPIRSADVLQHAMHWERFTVEREALHCIAAARAAGARVVAVGTTVVRTLESIAAWERGERPDAVAVQPTASGLGGRTRLFLHPPHRLGSVDALVTNFHLPRSTLLLLVDAFAGRDTVRAAYAHAVRERFRFFSYGDAMWIE